ncbi:MAG: tetratricopeptide repeat protein [Candidatus Kapaibacterium sp.]
MRKIYIFILLILVTSCSHYSQRKERERLSTYPDTYTFEKADTLQKNGEYEKALWFYINLFPDNKTQVVEIVRALATKLDTVDLRGIITKSAILYGPLDPTITSFKNGTPIINREKLLQKGVWANELIQSIFDSTKIPVTVADYFASGRNYMKKGNFKEAILDFDLAIDIEPTGTIYYNRAFAKSKVMDFYGAIEDYDKVIEFKFRIADAYFERGYCKDQLNNLEGAIEDFTKVIAIDPKFVSAYNSRALTKMKQKKYTEAIKDFDKSIEIKPGYGNIYNMRGYAKLEIGDKTGACDDWTIASVLGVEEAKKFMNEFCK